MRFKFVKRLSDAGIPVIIGYTPIDRHPLYRHSHYRHPLYRNSLYRHFTL